MEIDVRPRQNGKTHESIKWLLDNPDAIMICATHHDRTYLREMVREQMSQRPWPSPRLASDVDSIMDRIVPASSLSSLNPGNSRRVVVDDADRVLQTLFGGRVERITITG